MFKEWFFAFLAKYGTFYLYLLLGGILIAFVMQKIKNAGFGKKTEGETSTVTIPLYYWFLGAIFTLIWIAIITHEMVAPGGLLVALVHAVLLYGWQYFLSMKIVKKIVTALKNYALWKLERRTQQDINEDGSIGKPKVATTTTTTENATATETAEGA